MEATPWCGEGNSTRLRFFFYHFKRSYFHCGNLQCFLHLPSAAGMHMMLKGVNSPNCCHSYILARIRDVTRWNRSHMCAVVCTGVQSAIPCVHFASSGSVMELQNSVGFWMSCGQRQVFGLCFWVKIKQNNLCRDKHSASAIKDSKNPIKPEANQTWNVRCFIKSTPSLLTYCISLEIIQNLRQ